MYIHNFVLEITTMRDLIHLYPFLNMGSDFCRKIVKKIKKGSTFSALCIQYF